ncbi:MAG: hypothetical protein VZR08_04590 [Anaerovoracaceae bacterium]|nr:hypothetical protein [Anaerovoracaceae bacterium]
MGVDTAFAFDLPGNYAQEEAAGEAVLSDAEETDGPDIDGDAQGDPAFDVEEGTPEDPVTEEPVTEEPITEDPLSEGSTTDSVGPEAAEPEVTDPVVTDPEVRIITKEEPANRDAVYTVALNDDFPLNTDAHAGRLFEWIGGATFEVYDESGNVVTDEEVRSRYSFHIIDVTGTEEGFEWDMGESYVLSPVNDVIYTVQFAIFETATGKQVSPTYTRTIKTYNSSEILPL